jgi:hypothetical protein
MAPGAGSPGAAVVPPMASPAAPPAVAMPGRVSPGSPSAFVGAGAAPPMPQPSEPKLSLPQYASYRADCVTRPDDVDQLRKGYGLDEDSDRAEVDAWGRKFLREPSLFETYKNLFQRYRAMQASAPAATPGAGVPAGGGAAFTAPAPLGGAGRPAGSGAPAPVPAAASSSDAASAASDYPMMATAALKRILSLGQHAQMTAELLFSPEDAVYAKYGLEDAAIRAQVLRFCDGRLQDPTSRDTYTRLHDMAVKQLREAKK